MRFVGKCYQEKDRVNGTYGKQWGEAFAEGLFTTLEAELTDTFQEAYEDAGAYIGFMRGKEGSLYQYWIGMFLPETAAVPEGYGFVDFDAGNLGVCWLKGPEAELYAHEDLAFMRMEEEHYEIIPGRDGTFCAFERYGCPRFTTPDENGDVILDICSFIK